MKLWQEQKEPIAPATRNIVQMTTSHFIYTSKQNNIFENIHKWKLYNPYTVGCTIPSSISTNHNPIQSVGRQYYAHSIYINRGASYITELSLFRKNSLSRSFHIPRNLRIPRTPHTPRTLHISRTLHQLCDITDGSGVYVSQPEPLPSQLSSPASKPPKSHRLAGTPPGLPSRIASLTEIIHLPNQPDPMASSDVESSAYFHTRYGFYSIFRKHKLTRTPASAKPSATPSTISSVLAALSHILAQKFSRTLCRVSRRHLRSM